MKRKLYVKKTTRIEIHLEWDTPLPSKYVNGEMYVRCNAKGIVNFHSTLVYTVDELLLRGNVVVVKD